MRFLESVELQGYPLLLIEESVVPFIKEGAVVFIKEEAVVFAKEGAVVFIEEAVVVLTELEEFMREEVLNEDREVSDDISIDAIEIEPLFANCSTDLAPFLTLSLIFLSLLLIILRVNQGYSSLLLSINCLTEP